MKKLVVFVLAVFFLSMLGAGCADSLFGPDKEKKTEETKDPESGEQPG